MKNETIAWILLGILIPTLFGIAMVTHADCVQTLDPGNSTDSVSIGFTSNANMVARFEAACDGHITQVEFHAKHINGSSITTTGKVFDDNAGEPDEVLYTGSSGSITSGTCDFYTRDFTDAEVTSGTNYWVGVGAPPNASDYDVACGQTSGGSLLAVGVTGDWYVYPTIHGYMKITIASSTPPEEGGGGGGEISTAATSSINQTQQNVYNGFIIFMVFMMFPIWFFKKRV